MRDHPASADKEEVRGSSPRWHIAREPLSRQGVKKVLMWIRAVLVPDRRGRAVQPNLGDKRPDRALAKRTGHGDAVVPVEHVVGAAASVELDGVHPAAGSDLGCDSLKPRPRVIGSRPEPAVKAPRRVHRADNLADRHHRLTSWSEAADPFILQPPAWSARAGGARYLAQHCQAVAAGWTAEQPAGHLGPVRPPPGTVKIIAGVLLDQSGTHAPEHGNFPFGHAPSQAAPFGVNTTLCSTPPRAKGRTGR